MRLLALALAAAGAVSGVWLLWPAGVSPAGADTVASSSAAGGTAPSAQRSEPDAAREPIRFERWMGAHSSLRGADLDGAWDVDAQGRLRPTIALRRRFDQLLGLLGEATLEQIGASPRRIYRKRSAARPSIACWRASMPARRFA